MRVMMVVMIFRPILATVPTTKEGRKAGVWPDGVSNIGAFASPKVWAGEAISSILAASKVAEPRLAMGKEGPPLGKITAGMLALILLGFRETSAGGVHILTMDIDRRYPW